MNGATWTVASAIATATLGVLGNLAGCGHGEPTQAPAVEPVVDGAPVESWWGGTGKSIRDPTRGPR